MTDQEKVAQFLETQKHMVVAVTLDDGTPWAVPVTIQARDGLRVFEWDSRLDTVHSRALASRPQTAVTIYQKEGPRQIGFCTVGTTELIQSNAGFGRYRFTAEKAWLNDERFVKREIDVAA